MWPNPQETADLVTFTEEILKGKLHFLSSKYLSENYVDAEVKFKFPPFHTMTDKSLILRVTLELLRS